MAISEMRDSHIYGMGRSLNNLYQEYSPGDQISFPLHTLQSDGNIITSERSITIEDIRGGGFFGKVIIPRDENFVIKTSLPDPWHHLWRIVNWNFREFPAQSEEKSAKLEHLATRLIHNVLPVISNGRFYSPDSYGYTRLAPGYAQVVEKLTVVGQDLIYREMNTYNSDGLSKTC